MRSAAEYGNCSDPGLDDSGGCTRPEAQASGRFCAHRISSTREDRRRAVDNFRKVSWGRNPCSRRACPEAARVRDPAKVPGRMGKDGQKKEADPCGSASSSGPWTPRRAERITPGNQPGTHIVPHPAADVKAERHKKSSCIVKAAQRPKGLALTMRLQWDGARRLTAPGGAAAARQWGPAGPWEPAWRLPGAPSGGGGDGRGAGEKLPGQSRRGCVQSPQRQPRNRAGGRGRKKGGEAAVAPGDGAKRPLPAGAEDLSDSKPTDPPPEGGGGSGRSGARNRARPERSKGDRSAAQEARSRAAAGPGDCDRTRAHGAAKRRTQGEGEPAGAADRGRFAAGPARSGPAQGPKAPGQGGTRSGEKGPPGTGRGPTRARKRGQAPLP